LRDRPHLARTGNLSTFPGRRFGVDDALFARNAGCAAPRMDRQMPDCPDRGRCAHAAAL